MSSNLKSSGDLHTTTDNRYYKFAYLPFTSIYPGNGRAKLDESGIGGKTELYGNQRNWWKKYHAHQLCHVLTQQHQQHNRSFYEFADFGQAGIPEFEDEEL